VDIASEIERALEAGHRSLDEYDGKSILKQCGLPTVEEVRVITADEAVAAATDMGFPVVLKGLGRQLLHKSDQGLVHLCLSSEEAVLDAAASIQASAGEALEGFLVQQQIQGRREFVAGMVRDPQFGPLVLFGIGGILTEALADTALGVAPLSRGDALEMLNVIRTHKLLNAFRGEAAVDREVLADILMALSHVAVDHPELSEIDINPLIATPRGELVAVDALITLALPTAVAPAKPPIAPEEIRAIFYPRSIAFVGASATIGKWGHMLPHHTIGGGYAGEVYLINPKAGTIAGRKALPSIADLPGPVDLAVVTLPATKVLAIIPELSAKGIRRMVLVTSGFGETGEAGEALEARVVAAAREHQILLLGPNTMGISNPHIRLHCTGTATTPRPGSTAMVAQSGNLGTQLLTFAEAQGVGIRAFCGSGNEAMVTVEDYLDGFAADPKTRTVLLYLESVKDGRRFFNSARKVACQKPIVLLKGGQTRAGNRAASSHTGAMATDQRVFEAVCRQAGILSVKHSMDLLDLAAAFTALPLPAGKRVAIMTLGGGWGVVTTDLCARHGLEIPVLTPALVEEIDKLLPPYWSRGNPIDLVGDNDPSVPLKLMESLLKWEGCDAVIHLGIMGRRGFIEKLMEAVKRCDPSTPEELSQGGVDLIAAFEADYVQQIAGLMDRYAKPVVGVSLMKDGRDKTVYAVEGAEHKTVFYETPERAVKALSQMVSYRRFRRRCEAASV
jgi:acyl-CoA synthetase (NDP forming)